MVFFAGSAVNAETIYVHPTEGTYHTIAEGVNAAAVEDTVLVAPGEYESFTVNKKVYIVSEAGPDVTKITSGGPVTFNDPGDGASISGFTVSLSGTGIYVTTGCYHVRIENNIISGCGLHGIYFYASSGNIYYGVVRNNTVSNNGENGIYFRINSNNYDTRYIKYSLIANNIITSNNNYGIQYYNQNRGSFSNNTFSNNNLWNNTSGNTSAVTVSTDAGNFFSDPLFVNPDTGDFHLQSTSLCIDAGMVSSIYNDPDGTRNNMGAYGGPGAVAFWPQPAGGPVVTELLVTPPSVPVGGTLTLKATGKIR